MKKGAAIFLLVAMCFLLGFHAGRHISPGHEATPLSEARFPDQLAIIEHYLENSSMSNWEKALSVLSGEAFLNAQNNIARTNSTRRTKLLETELINFNQVGNFSILDMIVTTTTEDQKQNAVTFDRLNYRFHVLDNKIFSIEQLPSLPFYTTSQKKVDTDRIPAAENTVAAYLSLIEQNNWEEALLLLTGRARRSGLNAVSTMPRLPDLHFANLTVKTIGQIGDTTCFVLAEYGSAGSNMRVLFSLEAFENEWRIENIQQVSVSA